MQTADLDWGKMNITLVRLKITQVSLVYNAWASLVMVSSH